MSTADTRMIVVHNPPRRRRWSKEEPPLMRIVVLGSSVSENSLLGNFILGRAALDSEAPPDVVERVAGRLKGRHLIIINSPQLLQRNISDHQITHTVRECVFLSDPGPHVFILALQYKDFTKKDLRRVKYMLETFSEEAIKRTIVLTTDEETDKRASGKVNELIQQLTAECGGGHVQFNNEIEEWCSVISERLEKILGENHGEFLTCELFYDAEETLLDEDQSRSLASLRTKKDDPDGVSATRQQKLNMVLCGSDENLKKSLLNLIKEKRRDVELHDRQISVIELPALTGLSEEEVMRQTLRCVSLCHPGVHVFIIIIPDAPLNNEDKAETEKIQKIFSSRINKHIMILIKQSSEHQTEELSEETQSVIQRFGGRHQFFGPKTQVSTLMENIEQMLEENRGECFSTETFLETQMKKLMKYEEMKKKTDSLQTHLLSQGSSEREDELRIVLLGKTGVGKSATGNTILGREAFTAEESFESVTKESQRESSEISGRRVTVIDTPGLFDTELSNEEIQREITHCVSMILPGPHVFLLLVPLGRFTKEEETSAKIIQETFGEHSLMFTMVLFTRGDSLKKKTIDQCLGKPGSPLMKLIEACGNRYHVFNNNQTEDRTQVTDLLQKIDDMLKENGASFYSCKMFREMEREKQELQIKILMDRVREREEEMKKHEEEKERMNREREEEMKKHEEEKERMNREREEEMKKHEEEKERMNREREEEMKKHEEEKERMNREREEEMKKHEEEKERMNREREEEMKKHEEEKERVNREREELMKKHEEEKERMNREREELMKKHEEEKERMNREREEEMKKHEEEKERMNREREEEMKELEEEKERMNREREEEMKELEEEKERMNREREEEMKELEEEKERVNREREEEMKKHEEEKERMNREREEEMKKHEEEKERMNREREEEMKELEEEKERMNREREEEMKKHEEEKERMNREREEEMKKHEEEKERMNREREEEMKELEEEKERMNREREEEMKKHEEEKERMNREREEEMKKHEEEKDRMKMMIEEELREREERYKREMKEQEEQMRDEMKSVKEEYKNEIKEMRKEIETVKKEKETLQIRYNTDTDRLMNRIENERQNHETERKRREEEFKEREERYKREMKEQDQMRNEMKREREMLKDEMSQEKETVKKEKEKLQIEIDRMMKRIENERQNHETERKKREEEFIEREERYKTLMKEKEREMKEDMKREREEWEKQKLEEKRRREEEDEKRRVQWREEYEKEREKMMRKICSETDPSLKVTSYRKLETEYRKWSWSLRSAMMETENKLHNRIENEVIHEVEETDLQSELKKTSEEVKKSMSEFFEKDTDKYILIQWKTLFEIKIRELQKNIVRETKRKLNEILQQRDLKKEIDAQRTHHENTLYEKSRELALKLKDRTNDEETLKKEFDLFWEQSVKIIIRETPLIRDIDIMRDVREILSDIYESVPVDHRRESRDIFTVKSYSDYVRVKRYSGITGAYINAIRSAREVLGYILSPEAESQIRSFVTDVAQQTDRMIHLFNISKMGYHRSCIQQIRDYIRARVIQHEEERVRYVFKNEFFIDLVLSICQRANKKITEQHTLFREDNDPVIHVEKKREEYYSIFQKYCRGAASAAIFGEIICQKLKEPIEQSVYKKPTRDIADEMRSNCESLRGNRSNLEKHILKTLAEEEDFNKYMNYIHNPRDHFKRFIRDEVSRYITDQFSDCVLPKMKENIRLLEQKIMRAAHQSTEHVQEKRGDESTERVQENRGDAGLWLKSFTQQLSDELIFSEKHLSGVKHDDVDDFKLLEDVIRQELHDIISDISWRFNTNTFPVKLDCKFRPDELLIDDFCQCCWVQCPFCKAVCTNTTENHPEDHSAPLHRVTGVNGYFYSGTTNLCINICTTAVASDQCFYPDGSERSVPRRDYRRAGGVYADWSITPDLSEPLYWKWFVCRFQRDLEKYYERTFEGSGEIPDTWRTYSKQEAIESLEKYL